MAVNANMTELLELVVCPSCRSALASEPPQLHCSSCGRRFPLHERVPVLLDTLENERGSLFARLKYAVLGNPRVYDFHQAHFGGRSVAAQVERELGQIDGATLLDIGAGTGMVAGLTQGNTRYIWLDNDTQKLRGLLSKPVDCFAVLGDATQLPFGDDIADATLMIDVAHHIPDGALQTCLSEAARVSRDRLIFVDPLRGRRLRSKFLWQLDLGRFPRTEAELVDALETSFEVERLVRFRGINHDHVMCICRPRSARSEPSARVV